MSRFAVCATAIAGLAVIGLARPALAPAAGVATCDRVAAPTGSDRAPGSVAAPFASVQKLVDRLSAGQTGCLRAGTFSGDVRFNHGGASGAPIRITGYPGESATVLGRIYVPSGSNFIAVTHLRLDGRSASQLPSPTIDASNVAFTDDDVTNQHTTICFDLGSAGFGTAVQVDIERDRIHGCGVLPANNHQHAIYDEQSQGVTIAYNLIYDNADRGINLYPNAQGGTITHNVIDSNGEGVLFSGDAANASSNNTVTANIISNSSVRYDVESWYAAGGPVGQGNVVQGNCLFGGQAGTVDGSGGGFTLLGNATADPQYQARATGNYHLAPTSGCLAVTGDIAATVDGTAATPGPAPPPASQAASARSHRVKRHSKHHARRHHARPRTHAATR